jgi:hypothetical protein
MQKLKVGTEMHLQSKLVSKLRILDTAQTTKLGYIDALRDIATLAVSFYYIYVMTDMATKWTYLLQMIHARWINLTMAGAPPFFLSAFTLYLSMDSK